MLAKEMDSGLGETQNQRDARIEELWARLEPARKGELDLKGLQRGLKKLDHPMQNADDMVRKILREVDTNGDGKIQYEEFRSFVERAERKLLSLFKGIDKDGDGKLDMQELQSAFRNAKLTVSNKRLSDFFHDLDENNDGFVTFDEWRDFLLFMPARDYDSQLRAVLSYYNHVVSVTPEGDSLVSEETLEGLGTESASPRSFLNTLFGSLYRVAYPAGPPASSEPISTLPSQSKSQQPSVSGEQIMADPDPNASQQKTKTQKTKISATEETEDLTESIKGTTQGRRHKKGESQQMASATDAVDLERILDQDSLSETGVESSPLQSLTQRLEKLTEFVPHPGYFVAGAIAGGVSRTATAPLDRLKVYLLVNTKGGADAAAQALKKGKPVNAVKNAARPFGDAVLDLYRAGGIKGFFAGNGLNVLKIMPESAIKFGSYEAAKRALANLEGHGDARQLTGWSKFAAGGVAGMVAQFCVYPLDTLKFRLQCETVEGGPTGHRLLRQTAVHMWADGGFRAAYRGVTMGLIGMFPYSAIDMGMFEFLKKSYRRYYSRWTGCHEDDAAPGNVATGIIGASSGAFGASVVYPLNVVRTRLQTQGTKMHPPTYTGIWDVTTKTLQKEGWRGLYKGLTPNLLKVAPALSITWVVYENSKKMLQLH